MTEAAKCLGVAASKHDVNDQPFCGGGSESLRTSMNDDRSFGTLLANFGLITSHNRNPVTFKLGGGSSFATGGRDSSDKLVKFRCQTMQFALI